MLCSMITISGSSYVYVAWIENGHHHVSAGFAGLIPSHKCCYVTTFGKLLTYTC